MKIIDDFLNRITMYRLMLYYLIVIVFCAAVLGLLRLLPYDPIYIVISSLFLILISGAFNDFFSMHFSATLNTESSIITGLILSLIINPAKSPGDFIFLTAAAFFAMSTKFILTLGRKHIFNPAAIAVVFTSLIIGKSATWWVGNVYLFPVIVLGGLLVIRKTRHEKMFLTLVSTSIISIIVFSVLKGTLNIPVILENLFFNSSLFFFAFVMATEPLTMPTTKKMQYAFAVLVGFLFTPDIHIGRIYSTPELALIMGNIFAYIVSPKYKLILHLKEKIKLADGIYDFIFPIQKKIIFKPGQYLEWTLGHDRVDDRGNRRYFTIASSPTEDNIRIGVRFVNHPSSFKNKLLSLTGQIPIVASQLSGDFTLPDNKFQKLVFIAGGIGITPYRSMIKYLLDKNDKRIITIFYSNRNLSEIVYKDIFDQAEQKLNIKVVYTLTDMAAIPENWTGEKGRVNLELIRKYVPDYRERIFYLSGPKRMVDGFEETLRKLEIKKQNIRTDFFPGFV